MDTDIAEFFKTIIEHTSESIFLINASGLIVFAGQETNKKLEGKSFLDVVSKTHHGRIRKAISDAFKSKRPITCELKGWIVTPRASWFSCRISPVLKEKNVTSAVIFASDITDRRAENLMYKKRVQQKLRKYQQRSRAVENILTMCARTKKIQFNDEWLSIEDFLWKRYGFKISHGVSPEVVKEEWNIIDEMALGKM